MVNDKKLIRKDIEAALELRRVMADYFIQLDNGVKSGKQKIAWCSSVGPAEILRSLGFLVYFPENHAAMLGSTRMATDMIPYANAIGYSPEICSYLTSDIGAYLKKTTPLSRAYPEIKGIPRPDVLVFNTNQCKDVQAWFQWFGNEFKAPVIGLYTHRNVKDVTDNYVRSIAQQMEGLIEPLEKISSRKFDINELKKVLALSRECSDLWKQVLFTSSTIPSPFTFYDGVIHMGPAVVLRGTNTAVEYYKILLNELNDRIKNHVSGVDEERFRLYWDGMPIWGRLRDHSEFFASLKACIVASTYCNSWIFSSFNPSDPFNSMARAYTELFIVRSDEAKEQYLKEMFKTFKIDGIIYHDSKTCPNNSNNRYGMPQRLEKQTGIKSLVVNGDLNDTRCLSDEQIKTNIEAFIEQLGESKG